MKVYRAEIVDKDDVITSSLKPLTEMTIHELGLCVNCSVYETDGSEQESDKEFRDQASIILDAKLAGLIP